VQDNVYCNVLSLPCPLTVCVIVPAIIEPLKESGAFSPAIKMVKTQLKRQ
jgi:hypothetical protein